MMIDSANVTRMTSSTFSPTTRCNRKRCKPNPNTKASGSMISVAATGFKPSKVVTRSSA